MAKVTRTGEIVKSTCCAAIPESELDVTTYVRTNISLGSLGPSAGSYRPPILGRFRSSRRTGLTICLTEILRISCEVRNENDMLVTVEGIGCAIFILADAQDAAKIKSRKRMNFRVVTWYNLGGSVMT